MIKVRVYTIRPVLQLLLLYIVALSCKICFSHLKNLVEEIQNIIEVEQLLLLCQLNYTLYAKVYTRTSFWKEDSHHSFIY